MSEDLLEVLIADVLALAPQFRLVAPHLGDLVYCPITLFKDRDAIGWLMAHGNAPYLETDALPCGVAGPQPEMREVWDIVTLSGARGFRGGPLRRWENADFYTLPEEFWARARKLEARRK